MDVNKLFRLVVKSHFYQGIKNCLKTLSDVPNKTLKKGLQIMAISCWAYDCNHNNLRETCRFYRFPLDKKIREKWISFAKRNKLPTNGSRLCSCHFLNGNKENGPLYFKNSDTNFSKTFQQNIESRGKIEATASSGQLELLRDVYEEHSYSQNIL